MMDSLHFKLELLMILRYNIAVNRMMAFQRDDFIVEILLTKRKCLVQYPLFRLSYVPVIIYVIRYIYYFQ